MPDQYVYFEGIEEAKKLFGPAVVERAVVRTVNRISTTARKEADQHIRKTWNIKKVDGKTPSALVKGALDIRKARFGTPEALILGEGKRIPLSAFGAKQKWRTRRGKRYRRGVVLQVRKTSPAKIIERSIFMNAIRGNENNVHVMRRKGRARKPTDLLFGPAVPHMLGAKTTMGVVERAVGDNIHRVMQHELEFYIAREIKKIV